MIRFEQNRIYILITLFCLVVILLAFLQEINFFYMFTKYINDSGYRTNFGLAESSVKAMEFTLWSASLYFFNDAIKHSSIDATIIFSTIYFQLLLPIISSLAGYFFYQKYNSIYKMILYRAGTFRDNVIKSIHIESFKIALSIFTAYLILLFFVSISPINNSVIEGSRTFLLDYLGVNFFIHHTLLYFLIEGFFRFFIYPYILAFFACSLVLLNLNSKAVYITPILYYYGLSLLMHSLSFVFGQITIYLNPTTIMSSGDYTIRSIPLIIGTFLPFYIGIFITLWKTHHVEI